MSFLSCGDLVLWEISDVKSLLKPIESEDQIVKLFTDKFDAEPDIDFALIDHISSASALVFPIKEGSK